MNLGSLCSSARDKGKQRVFESRDRFTVLVLDDEAAMRTYLVTTLTESGYEVVAAAYAETALSSLGQSRVDAMILDVRLPRRSGLDVLERIRQNPAFQHMPVFILTGVSLSEEEEDRIRRYPAYIFYKQEGVAVLVEKLDELLRGSAAEH